MEYSANGKLLYAVAFEHRKVIQHGNYKTVVMKPDVEYLHAHDQGEARILFTSANPDRSAKVIVGIAPVVGVHHDDNGENRHA